MDFTAARWRSFNTKPFQPRARTDDPALPALLQVSRQMGESVILHRVRQEPFRQLSGRVLPKGRSPSCSWHSMAWRCRFRSLARYASIALGRR